MICPAKCHFRRLHAMTFVGGLKISLLPMAYVFLKAVLGTSPTDLSQN
jgi:hypothetical protein